MHHDTVLVGTDHQLVARRRDQHDVGDFVVLVEFLAKAEDTRSSVVIEPSGLLADIRATGSPVYAFHSMAVGPLP